MKEADIFSKIIYLNSKNKLNNSPSDMILLFGYCLSNITSSISIEISQIEETSHRPLCKWQRQSANSVTAKERDDERFFLSLSTRTALERDSLTLHIALYLSRLSWQVSGWLVSSICNISMSIRRLKQLFGRNGRALENVPIFRRKCY